MIATLERLAAWLGRWAARFKQSSTAAFDFTHFAIGFITVILFHRHPYVGLALGIGWAAFIECYFDPRWERHETTIRREDVIDLVFYVAGAVCGVLYVLFVLLGDVSRR